MSDDPGLRGADAPRPLPLELHARIEAQLLERPVAAARVAALGGPRPLPPALRARLIEALSGCRPRVPQVPWASLAAAVGAVALVASILAAGGASSESHGGARRPANGLPAAGHTGLAAFSSCAELLAYFRTNASADTISPGRHSSRYGRFTPVPDLAMAGGAAGGAAGAAAASGGDVAGSVPVAGRTSGSGASTAGGTSTSNVQEAGVDEPDALKSDGAHLYVVTRDQLRIVDISGNAPVVVSSTPVAAGSRLLLAGSHLLVLASTWDSVTGRPGTEVVSLDVTDPARPTPAGRTTLDGQLVAARLIGGASHLVVDRAPQLPYAAADGTPLDPTTVIANSTIDQWIGDRPCDSVAHPEAFSGLDLVSIYTVDPAAPSPDNSTSIVAGAATVYASSTDIYVAQQPWSVGFGTSSGGAGMVGPAEETTEIHQLAYDPKGTRYVASGAVPGHLLDQFSMSQADGRLRVATSTWGQGSGVTVLEPRDGALVAVGQLSGLEPDEQITAARFIGPRAYLVTAVALRDPLFVIDLSDPTAPRELGRVELPGFSSYVHPLDDSHILAIGPDGAGNLAAKLFDVTDPTAPALAGSVVVAGTDSPVRSDHLAFLYWRARGIAVIPYYAAGRFGPCNNVDGLAVAFDGSSIRQDGVLNHTQHAAIEPSAGLACIGPTTWRSAVVGDRLYTISDLGLLTSDVASLADRSWLPFAG